MTEFVILKNNYNKFLGGIILVLYCFQSLIYSDILWNMIKFDDVILNVSQTYRILTDVISFLSAMGLWLASNLMFHITALIIGNSEIEFKELLEKSSFLLFVPLVVEYEVV